MSIDFKIRFLARILGEIAVDSYEAVGEIAVTTDGDEILSEQDFPILDLAIELSGWDGTSSWNYAPAFMAVGPLLHFEKSGENFSVWGISNARSTVSGADLRSFRDRFLSDVSAKSGYRISNGAVKYLR